MQGSIQIEGVPPIPLSGTVELGPEWLRVRFRSEVLEARRVLPPVILLDKPLGVVTSRVRDGGAATVFDVLPGAVGDRVEPAGRLDLDSSGLLILTAHGPLIQRLTHPRHAVPRSYRVEVDGTPDPEVLRQVRAGTFVLRDGHAPAPTELEAGPDGEWRITLTEGKYHEVRRIFAAAGAPVRTLRRTHYAHLSLDDLHGLPWRRLEESEVAALYAGLRLALPLSELEVRGGSDATPGR